MLGYALQTVLDRAPSATQEGDVSMLSSIPPIVQVRGAANPDSSSLHTIALAPLGTRQGGAFESISGLRLQCPFCAIQSPPTGGGGRWILHLPSDRTAKRPGVVENSSSRLASADISSRTILALSASLYRNRRILPFPISGPISSTPPKSLSPVSRIRRSRFAASSTVSSSSPMRPTSGTVVTSCPLLLRAFTMSRCIFSSARRRVTVRPPPHESPLLASVLPHNQAQP